MVALGGHPKPNLLHHTFISPAIGSMRFVHTNSVLMIFFLYHCSNFWEGKQPKKIHAQDKTTTLALIRAIPDMLKFVSEKGILARGDSSTIFFYFFVKHCQNGLS